MPDLGITGQRPVQQTRTEQAAGGPGQRANELHCPVQFAGAHGARIDGVLHARSRTLSAGDRDRMNARPGPLSPREFERELGQIMAWVGTSDAKADAPLRDSLQRYLRPRGDSAALPTLARLRFDGGSQQTGRVNAQAAMAFAADQDSADQPQSQP